MVLGATVTGNEYYYGVGLTFKIKHQTLIQRCTKEKEGGRSKSRREGD